MKLTRNHVFICYTCSVNLTSFSCTYNYFLIRKLVYDLHLRINIYTICALCSTKGTNQVIAFVLQKVNIILSLLNSHNK